MYLHAQREGLARGSARGHSSIQQQQFLGRQTRHLLVSIAVCWAFLVLGYLGAAASDRKGSEQLWFLHFPPMLQKWPWMKSISGFGHLQSILWSIWNHSQQDPRQRWRHPEFWLQYGQGKTSWPHHLPHVQGTFLPPTPWGFQIKSGQVMSFLIVQKACQSV